MMVADDTLMLLLSSPACEENGRWFVDARVAANLRMWLRDFARVTLLQPSVERGEAAAATAFELEPLDALAGSARLEVIALPDRQSGLAGLVGGRTASGLIEHHIDRCRYLVFALDQRAENCGALAARIAWHRKRAYAVWADSVSSEASSVGRSELPGQVLARAWRRNEREMLGRSALGLLEGFDVYRAYWRYGLKPMMVHGPVFGQDRADFTAAREHKLRKPADAPLSLANAGRVDRDSGYEDWIDTLAALRASGRPFAAHWYGGGPCLETARGRVGQVGLSDCVTFTGRVDFGGALESVARQDVLLFCARTPGATFPLAQSLAAGTPIVGYWSWYARDLISGHGGGILKEAGDTDRLVASLSLLDRTRLADLSSRAAADGARFLDDEGFHARSSLVKRLPLISEDRKIHVQETLDAAYS